ncbi:MAG TPA: Crp/Fnr family transcriptional regulator [Allosphingosinicella sp.]|jgi:CRP-like cAMP-binding protein|nr:Crp/Fnr family transcriptional regulator [Allosphingosinicella sp.]
MPRFFFHIRNGNGFTEDEEGQELQDERQAEKVAVRSARSLLSAEATEGEIDLRGAIEVADEGGGEVMTVAFRDVLGFKRGGLGDGEAQPDAGSAPIGEALVSHLSCIGELSDEDRRAVAALDGEIRDVPRYQDILRSGDHPTNAVVILSGFLHRYTVGPEGARQIHSFYIPTDAPCLETLHLDYMDNNLAACVDSRIGLIPHRELYRLMDERPDVLKVVWRETLIQGAVFREWLMRNSNMPAHAAMAHFFCEIFTRSRAAGLAEHDSCPLPITQELLSDALGLTPVHTNRTLMLLRDGGLLEWRSGRLKVKDWDRLCALAEFDPAYLHLRC